MGFEGRTFKSVVILKITFQHNLAMSCVPLIAYFIDLLATLIQQFGYLIQK